MKMLIPIVFLLFCSLKLFAQNGETPTKHEFSKIEMAEINKYFFVPGAEIFEGRVLGHESYRDVNSSPAQYSIVKLEVTKSFSKNIKCGIVNLKTRAFNGWVKDLKDGTTYYIHSSHELQISGDGLYSCTRLSDSLLTLNSFFGYEHDGTAARLNPGSRIRLKIEHFENLYTLLPKATICLPLNHKANQGNLNNNKLPGSGGSRHALSKEELNYLNRKVKPGKNVWGTK
ncbi:MAG: hypothetical protein V4543_01865 [Bacteroidota bacterium]